LNANDLSGNGNHGTQIGATLTSDRYANSNAAFFFDGNSEIDCGVNESLNLNECSIAAWVYLTTTAGFQTILAKYDEPNGGSYFLDMFENKAHINFTKTDFSYIDLVSNKSLSVNQWYHILVTHDPSVGIKIFINGILDASLNNAFNVRQVPSHRFRIGRWGPFSPQFPLQNGKIDDIGVWNRVLTQAEITALYNGATVGIRDLAQADLFSVYPNPTKDHINLNADPSLLGADYTVYDQAGKIILTGKINDGCASMLRRECIG
jgi:hypothetical protein